MQIDQLMAWVDASTMGTLVAALFAVLLGLLVHRIGAMGLVRLTRAMPLAAEVVAQSRPPTRLLLPLIALQAVWQGAADDMPWISGIRHANGLLLLAALTWLGMRAVRGIAQGVIAGHPVDVEDNLSARRIRTQTQLLARTAMLAVLVAGLALMLMTFPDARQFGASLLASAGVVGIVAGIAARPVLSNLIAGLQIALAQPFRLDDVLIVKGEWGRVEEITGTYVVFAIWDQRRMIIPLQWFIENPFENWTRASAQIIGTVFLWVDYRMPLAPLREEAARICAGALEWDQRLCLLQVTEAGTSSVQLRLLVTAANSSLAWDLRCRVREGLVDFMQKNHPEFLPLMRADIRHEPAGADAGSTKAP